MKSLSANSYSKIIVGIFLAMLLWWVYIFTQQFQDTNHNYLYGAAMGVLPIIGGIFGLLNAKKWGRFTSAMGKTLSYLSYGLITWGLGTLVFAYYNIYLQVGVPYPSVADALYIISWPLWVMSMYNLSKATGMKFQLKNVTGRWMLFAIPLVTIAFSYYLLVIVARDGVITAAGDGLKIFFDLAYPIGDVVILSTALLIYGLSFNYLGGFFKVAIMLVLVGFVGNYIGDTTFVYGTTKGTYFVANWTDLIYTATYFLLSLGASLMDPHRLTKSVEPINEVKTV
jgi:hypothetical protein